MRRFCRLRVIVRSSSKEFSLREMGVGFSRTTDFMNPYFGMPRKPHGDPISPKTHDLEDP